MLVKNNGIASPSSPNTSKNNGSARPCMHAMLHAYTADEGLPKAQVRVISIDDICSKTHILKMKHMNSKI